MGPSLVAALLPGAPPRRVGAGCCGMAGSFGYESRALRGLAQDRRGAVSSRRSRPPTTASSRGAGVSCRQQIEHFTDRRTKHIAEVLADALP